MNSITVIHIHSINQIDAISSTSSNSWILITLVKFHNSLILCPIDNCSLYWWIFIRSMSFHRINHFSSHCHIFIKLINFHHFNEFSSYWRIFIRSINFYHINEFITLKTFHQWDKSLSRIMNFCHNYKFSSQW